MIFPIRHWGDELNWQPPDRVGTDDYGRARLFNFRAYSRVEIDQPDFTALW